MLVPMGLHSQDFDTVIVGGGQAGPGLASALDGRGERVALIQDGPFGGTCLNDGCRPTKAIRASAHAAHVARTAGRLGVHVEHVRVDLAAVVARKDALIGNWRDRSTDYYEHHRSISYMTGRGKLAGTEPDGRFRVDVAGTVLTARRVILNTGARSVPPPISGLNDVAWLDHHSILDLTQLPDHLVVVGGSYIGLEFGQIFRRFGAQVTVLEHSARVIAREDPEVSDTIADMLRGEGVDIRTSAAVERIEAIGPGDAAARVHLGDGATVEASHVLVAAGRVPNSDDLGLETVGVATDGRGYVTTDEHFATNVPGIYAVGDVNGRGAFTHTSYQDYEILADHLAGGDRSVAGRIPTYALFTDPPLGRVGITERDARAQGRDIDVVSYPMEKVTRAVLDGETAGLVRLVIDRERDRLLGAAIFGHHGDEVVHTLSMMMHLDAPLSALATWLPIHPTVSEFLPTIASSR